MTSNWHSRIAEATGTALILLFACLVSAQVSPTAPAPNRNITMQPQAHRPPGDHPETNAGSIEGFVYWDANKIKHTPPGSCSGLAIQVNVGSSSGPFTAYTPLGRSNNDFKYVGQVKEYLVGGKINAYDVCTYGFGKVPVGPDLQVKLIITDPHAFSPYALPPSAILGPIKIINAKCNMLPRIVNPTTSDLLAHWGSCQNMAYDVNFPMQPPTRNGLTPLDSSQLSGMLSGTQQRGLLTGSTSGATK